jgi:hypothetical protein
MASQQSGAPLDDISDAGPSARCFGARTRQQTHSIIECAGSVHGPASLLHRALVVGRRSAQAHIEAASVKRDANVVEIALP